MPDDAARPSSLLREAGALWAREGVDCSGDLLTPVIWQVRLGRPEHHERGLNEKGRYNVFAWLSGAGPPGAGQIFRSIISARTRARSSSDV